MRKPETVAFDLDGTLVDTLADLAHATEEVLRRAGLGHMDGSPLHSLEEYRRYVGNGARCLIERAVGEPADPAFIDRLLKDFVRIYDRDCLIRSQLYPDIPEMIAALQERKIRLLVVTNKPEEQALKILRHFFPQHSFDGVCGGRTGRPPKPDPSALLATLNAAGAKPETALFVGDSDVDVMTAHHAGLPCAGAVWGFRGKEELTRAGADALLYRPLDLLRLLDPG